jgi:hypothetical protein
MWSLWVLALPPIVGVVLWIWLIVAGISGWAPILYADPVPGSTDALIEAILNADLATAHAAIQNGADPNAAGAVQRPDLVRIGGASMTPLALAVARGDETMVSMLVTAGAATGGEYGREAWCAAERRGSDDMRETLIRHGVKQPDDKCATPQQSVSRSRSN